MDDVVLEVGNHITHEITAHVHTHEIDGRIGQPVDVRAASSGCFDLSVVGNDILFDEFLYQFGNRRHGDMQLLCQLRQGALSMYGHVGDDVAFDEAVLVRDAFKRFVFLFVEEFG